MTVQQTFSTGRQAGSLVPRFTMSPRYERRDQRRAERIAERRAAGKRDDPMILILARCAAWIVLVLVTPFWLAVGLVLALVYWLATGNEPRLLFGEPEPQDICVHCATPEEIREGSVPKPQGQGYRWHQVQGRKLFGRSMTMEEAVDAYDDEQF